MRTILTVCLLSACLVCAAQGETRTAVSNGYWHTPGTWDTGVPLAGNDAVIPGGISVTLTNGTADLHSLTASGSVTFRGTTAVIRADTVVIDGIVTHNVNSDTNGADGWTADNRVYISCDHLTLSSSGSINVDGKGYQGVWDGNGHGPGAGTAGNPSGSGAGYGGKGGSGNTAGGPAYGSSNAPAAPGSAGGGSYNYWHSAGGAGGGWVRIEAVEEVTVDGLITANGGSGTAANEAGGGSGGAVYITCKRFRGAGTLRANGGGGGYLGGYGDGGGGSGGRIAVVYDVTEQAAVSPQPTVTISAERGTTGRQTGIGPGTLYFPDNRFYPAENLSGGRILIPGFTNWMTAGVGVSGYVILPDDLHMELTSNLHVHAGMGRLELGSGTRLECAAQVRTEGTLRVGSGWGDAGEVHCRSLVVTNGGTFLLSASNLVCNGNMTVGPWSAFYLYAGETNGANPDYGARVRVGGALTVCANGAVYPYSHYQNGGPPYFEVKDLLVHGGGQINASGKGYTGLPDQNGYGPGHGLASGSGASGAGHGGGGGDGTGGLPGGGIYGSSNAPVTAGSCGGGWANYGHAPGGYGGGVVRVQASRRVAVEGAIVVNGYNGTYGAGGGAGGSVYLHCLDFEGDGSISARGGDGGAGPYGDGGGGGGGRIAVWRARDHWTGILDYSNSVPGGLTSSSPDRYGETGTIYWGTAVPPGLFLLIR